MSSPFAAGPLDNDTAAKVLDALSCGAPVLVDTSGLWANQLDGERAVAAIFEAKGRPQFNPLISHVLDAAAARALCPAGIAART
jgi:L-threonylcarbamoyladenylate synthase